MTWVFSLPPAIDASRFLNNCTIERAYGNYRHVVTVESDDFWRIYFNDRTEIDDWCQRHFCYYFHDRVFYDKFCTRWTSNCFGIDVFFIVTNCDSGAMLAKLTWGY